MVCPSWGSCCRAPAFAYNSSSKQRGRSVWPDDEKPHRLDTAGKCVQRDLSHSLFVLCKLSSACLSLQAHHKRGGKGQEKGRTGFGHYRYGTFIVDLPFVLRGPDFWPVSWENAASRRIHLCGICQRGIFSAACSEHFKPGDCAVHLEFLSGKRSASSYIDSHVPLYLCDDRLQRNADDPVHSVL